MEHRILWAVAVLTAMLALVAGCFAPSKPLVVIGTPTESAAPPPPSRERVQNMDKDQLEQEVLRLTAENDRLRQEIGKLDRDNKKLEKKNDELKKKTEKLEDQVKDLKKH